MKFTITRQNLHNGLVAVEPDQWLAPATHRQWLSRMLNNLQAVFAHTGRERDLYAMQELQSLLVDGVPELN